MTRKVAPETNTGDEDVKSQNTQDTTRMLSSSTVCGVCCLTFLFMMHWTFSIRDGSGLQAGQSSTLRLPSLTKIVTPETITPYY